MRKQPTWLQQLTNRFYALPPVIQWWAKRAATQSRDASEEATPFTPFHKPLAACKVALITTAGVHLRRQTPFDMDNREGDASYRELPTAAGADEFTITHNYYDHSDADRDLNVVFPLAHFRDLVDKGVIGSLAPRHFGFMGHIEGEQLPLFNRKQAPEMAAKLRKDGVDFAFLTPA